MNIIEYKNIYSKKEINDNLESYLNKNP